MSRRYCFNTLSSLVLVAVTTAAHGYNTEVNIDNGIASAYSEGKVEYSRNFDSGNFETETDSKSWYIGTSVTMFFKDVAAGAGPWQEAAFLSKTGSVFLSLARLKIEEENENTSSTYITRDINQTDDLITTGARIILGSVILEPAYLSTKADYGNQTGETKTQDIQLGIGGYIGNFQEVVVVLGKTDIEYYYAREEEQPHFSLRYKAVFPIGKTARVHIAPYASYEFSELSIDNEDIGDIQTSIIGVTIYPRQDLGIGPEIRSELTDTKVSNRSLTHYYAYEDDSSMATIAFKLSYMPVETLLLNFRLSAISTYDEYSQEEDHGGQWHKYDEETTSGGLGLDTSLTFRF